jgi:hypothetical protein
MQPDSLRAGKRMKRTHRVLLGIDGIVNLALGAALLLFPAGLVGLLGLPPTSTYFYASILGAVILGIGVALLLELNGATSRIRRDGLPLSTRSAPRQKAGAIWRKWNWLTLKRHNGGNLEMVGETANFGSSGWVTDDYPDD